MQKFRIEKLQKQWSKKNSGSILHNFFFERSHDSCFLNFLLFDIFSMFKFKTIVLIKGKGTFFYKFWPIRNHRQFHLKLFLNKDLGVDTHRWEFQHHSRIRVFTTIYSKIIRLVYMNQFLCIAQSPLLLAKLATFFQQH